MTNPGPTQEESDNLIYNWPPWKARLGQARKLLEAPHKRSLWRRLLGFGPKAAVVALVVIFMVSSCAPSMDQERQQLLTPALKIMADSDARLKEDLRQFKEQDEAFWVQVEKFKQKHSIFMASLSDKELLALSALAKAQSEKDSALTTLTRRRLVSLMSDSGKIGAYMTMCRENDELLASANALDKRQAELKERVAKSDNFWATQKRMDHDWEEWKQHRELIDALHDINKPTRTSGTIMTPSGGTYFYNYNQY